MARLSAASAAARGSGVSPDVFALEQEFAVRQRLEPAYSRAAFARDLGISPSMLCRVLKGTKRLSTESALRLVARLPWPQGRKESFVQAVRERMAGHQEGPVDKETLVCADAFATVSRYEHPALLELLRVKALGGRVSALSRALGLPAARVREALERLQRLGFVTCEEGRWRRAEVGHVRVPDVPSQAIRDFHKSMLNQAWDAIDNVEPQARDCTGVVVATSLERLAGAKALVARFRRELRVYLEDCEPEVLYYFACQLFPVSEPA